MCASSVFHRSHTQSLVSWRLDPEVASRSKSPCRLGTVRSPHLAWVLFSGQTSLWTCSLAESTLRRAKSRPSTATLSEVEDTELAFRRRLAPSALSFCMATICARSRERLGGVRRARGQCELGHACAGRACARGHRCRCAQQDISSRRGTTWNMDMA